VNLGEMADLVCDKIGKSDATSLALCKRFIDRRYQLIYDSALWRDTLDIRSVETDQPYVWFDSDVGRVLAIRSGSDTEMSYGESSHLFRTDPSIFERTGTPVHFTHLPPAASPLFDYNTTTSIIAYSSSAEDVGVELRVRPGRTLNLVLGPGPDETVVLNGTAPVSLVGSAQYYEMASKPVTVGTVTLAPAYGFDDGLLGNLDLGPNETHKVYPRVRIYPTPTTDTTLLCLCKLRRNALIDPLDAPILGNCEDAIMHLAQADMLERFRQYAKAEIKKQEARVELDKMRDLEKNQSAHITRIIPVVESAWETEYDTTL
jgi:hypothetical protein